MAKLQQWFKQKKARVIAGALGIVVVGVAIWFFTRPDSDVLRVPLGVEQAAIVTYSGPKLVVAPYKWGVAVNVRIADIIEQQDRRVYDVRYIVNRSGTFDLKDYLAADDGSDVDGLPTFKFAGDPALSKNLDTRIQETEEVRVEVGGRYYETLAVLTVLWIGWLLLLIFYKRAKPEEVNDFAEPEPTLTEQLRDFLVRLENGTLDASAKAKLEMTLLGYWRTDLSLEDQQMAAALGKISRDDKTREPLRKLQNWLHHPASSVSVEEIAAVIKPCTVEAAS